MANKRLMEGIDLYNEFAESNDLKQIETKGVKEDVLMESFFQAVESMDKKNLKKIDVEVINIFNELVKESGQGKKEEEKKPTRGRKPTKEGTVAKEKKKQVKPAKEKPTTKKAKAEKKPAKKSGGGEIRPGSKLETIYHLLKKPMTFPSLVKEVERKLGKDSANPSNVRVYLSQLNSRGLLEKTGDKYRAK